VTLLVHVKARFETIWLPGAYLALISDRIRKNVPTRFSPGGQAGDSKPRGDSVLDGSAA